MKNWPKIYYISQGSAPAEHLENITNACQGGCKLIQLRLKDVPQDVVLRTAQKAKVICDDFKVKLVVNDFLEVARTIPSVGLHIGKNDPPISQARIELESALIGGTANTIDDCIRLSNEGADYIGLGPFQFTTTKKNLEPQIGFSGYKDILTKLSTLRINLPVYAIGGITEKEIQPLLNLGLNGVAVSGLLTNKTELQIKDIISCYE